MMKRNQVQRHDRYAAPIPATISRFDDPEFVFEQRRMWGNPPIYAGMERLVFSPTMQGIVVAIGTVGLIAVLALL